MGVARPPFEDSASCPASDGRKNSYAVKFATLSQSRVARNRVVTVRAVEIHRRWTHKQPGALKAHLVSFRSKGGEQMRDLRLHGFYASAIVLALSLSLFSTSARATSREQVIYAFSLGYSDCSDPIASLIADESGNLYGTTLGGGAYGGGCIFNVSLNPDGSWSESVLYSFSGIDGKVPGNALVFDKVGNLYGMTRQGGLYDGGVAFELSPSPGGTWTETVLHSFGSAGDGDGPSAELTFDDAGNLYGTTTGGGAHRGGIVFKLSPGPSGWTETILHAFWGRIQGPGPAVPAGGVVIDSAGSLYGVTEFGGGNGGFGAAYQLVPKNGVYKERTIHSFDGYDGEEPSSTLVMDSSGNLYRTTSFGGSGDYGTVFQLTKGKAGKWADNVLRSLNGNDGYLAVGPVVFDSAGNLYAAAEAGGFEGQGSVFRLTPQRGGTWRETVLHLFHYYDRHYRKGRDGQAPYAGVIVYGGQLFGTTSSGGIHDEGTVFSIRLAHP